MFLEFDCDHFQGVHGRVLRGCLPGGGGGWRNVVVGHCFWRVFRGPQHPDPHRSQPPAGGNGTSWGKLHEVSSQRNGLDDNGGQRTRRQKNHSEAEKEKTMKTWDQRRKRRPLGSVFVGQTQKNEA